MVQILISSDNLRLLLHLQTIGDWLTFVLSCDEYTVGGKMRQ